MNARRRLTAALLLAGSMAAGSAACGNKESDSPTVPSGNVPRITAVTPNIIQPASSPQTITVEGDTFINGLSLEVIAPSGNSVSLNGNAIQSLASNTFQADVTFDVPGNYTLRVRNPNGAESDAFALQVGSSADSAPQVTAISPSTVVRSAQSVLIVLQGRNLESASNITMTPPSGASVTLGGNQILSISSTEIDLSVVLNAAGTYTFVVTSGLGGSSTPISLTVL